MNCRALVRFAAEFEDDGRAEDCLIDLLMSLRRKMPSVLAARIVEFRGVDLTDVSDRLFQYYHMDIDLGGWYGRFIFHYDMGYHIVNGVFGRYNQYVEDWPRIFAAHDYYISDDVAASLDAETARRAVKVFFGRPYDPVFGDVDADCVIWSVLAIIALADDFYFTDCIIDGRSERIDRLIDMMKYVDGCDYPTSDELLDVAARYTRY